MATKTNTNGSNGWMYNNAHIICTQCGQHCGSHLECDRNLKAAAEAAEAIEADEVTDMELAEVDDQLAQPETEAEYPALPSTTLEIQNLLTRARHHIYASTDASSARSFMASSAAVKMLLAADDQVSDVLRCEDCHAKLDANGTCLDCSPLMTLDTTRDWDGRPDGPDDEPEDEDDDVVKCKGCGDLLDPTQVDEQGECRYCARITEMENR